MKLVRRVLCAAALALAAGAGWAQSSIVMASTTSTEQSGLFAHLLPQFQRATGIAVKVVAVGTGQAIDMARRGDADVLFVHDRAAEEKFVADGFGERRHPVMYNDFVLVGPASDPARVKGPDIVAAMRRIAAADARFVSRGDKSGTDAAEKRFWQLAGTRAGSGVRECGCGMGPALNIASSTGAYVLADRASWLSFRNRGELAVLVEGDRRLFNQYGVVAVSARKFPHVKHAEAARFVEWVTSQAGQQAIAAYRIGSEQLFFPNAGSDN
ncbi:MAG TPA: substrate-binding domain-containing protein [Ramlibacter sp.]|jgi:tungstate transport system substrate-binding protein|nr:substrate-binding domain-containing protein [Ramlibacter sp.]